MDKGYEKERFESLSIKASVVKKFRKFCKAISRSQSMTLLLMIEFFEYNGISPKESIGPNLQTLESLIKKRIHGVISIIKDMEKHQTKPTVAMLQNLFEQADTAPGKSKSPNKKLWQEKKAVPGQKSNTSIPVNLELEDIREQLSFYKDKCSRTTQELSNTKKEIGLFLDKVKPIRSNFGKPYLRIDLPPETLEHLKRKLNLNE
ncbi:BfmA/BtgA family mobilization protein [Sinomicrobium oceani]|uniref:BfmA/BtgA family mobilization protein n=1 Tax=Sinomicrobium oceani TaxID=1150368 RepID=UPI00227D4F63|nr:BfmA/BtgA family mobilization protein [Sinomicrobium oceani]